MALSHTIPTVWSRKIWQKLRKLYVFADAFTNREYEGDLRAGGDTVKITGVGSVTVSDFTGTLSAPEELSDVDKGTLQATELDSFHFNVPLVKSKQSILNVLNEYSQEAAISLAAAVDAFIAAFHSQVDSGNLYGNSTTPIVIGFGTGEVTPYDAFLQLNQLLDEADVPREGRVTVVPPWYNRALKRQIGERDTSAGDDMLRNGRMTPVDGTDIRISNLVVNTSGAKYKVMLGLPKITFAETIAETATYKPELNFDTAVKGLHVYGAKLTHPTALALGTFSKGQLTM